jgi:hypothetical protein
MGFLSKSWDPAKALSFMPAHTCPAESSTWPENDFKVAAVAIGFA